MELHGTFPWNSIEYVLILHGKCRCRNFHGISMEIGALMFSMEFHGKCPNPPCKYFPWKSMEKFQWNSMEIDVLILHGIPWRFFTRDFYADVSCKREGLLSDPMLPRKRRTLVRLEVGAGAPSYPQTAKDHFRGVYYEGIHLIVGLFITAFSSYAQMETLLVKAHIGDDEAEFSFVMRHTAKMLIQGRYLSN